MTESKEVNKTTTKKRTVAKKVRRKNCEYLEYFDVFALRMSPVPIHFLDKLAAEIIKWSNKKTSMKFVQFVNSKGISSTSFYRWIKANKSEALNEAHKYALETIGARRELGGLNRKLEPSIVKFSMPIYDKEWKELEEWRSSLKAKEASEQTHKIVVIDRLEDPKKDNE